MRKKIIKIVLLIVLIVLVVESVFLIKFVKTNKEADAVYEADAKVTNSLTALSNQTLESNFSSNQVDESIATLKKDADQNKKDSTSINTFFVRKQKMAQINEQQKQIQTLIDKITSENKVTQEVDGLLEENPYTNNELSKTVSLKDEVSEEMQASINDRINNLPQSEKKEILIKTMAAISEENKKGKKLVALTFDDGPNDSSTIDILNTLKKYNIKATFFCVGSMVEKYPDTLKRIHAEGHEVGNHSYSHKNLPECSEEVLKKEILGTNEIIKNVIGVEPTLFRPPYGAYNDAIKQMSGMRIMLWNVDSLDWENKNTQQTISNIENNVSEGDIILMHDIRPTSAAALETLILDLKKQGYSFCLASELPTS